MPVQKMLLGLVIIYSVTPSFAQEVAGNDCTDQAEKSQAAQNGDDECLALPPQTEATNFIGGLAPAALVGAGAVAALAGGGGSTVSTTSTTN